MTLGRSDFDALRRRQRCSPGASGLAALAVLASLFFIFVHSAFGAEDEWEYEVKSGETLWGITVRYLKDMTYLQPLQRLNKVERPVRMPPGTRLRIPSEWVKSEPAYARFIAVQGDVRVDGASGTVDRPATSVARLEAGDQIRTPADGNALLGFADGSKVLLHADSNLKVKVLRNYATGAAESRLELLRGRTETQVQHRPQRGTRFEINTPAGVTSVRGTDFRVAAAPTGEVTQTEVLLGSVGVDAAGQGVRVDAGFGTRVQAGQPPAPPVRLLPAPDLADLPARVERLPWTIAVKPTTGAGSYRLQLAPGKAFDRIVFEGVAPEGRFELPELPNGSYVLRIRAIDAAGLEGLHAERAIELDARPQAPPLIEPEPEAVIVGPDLALRWSGDDARLTYRVQIASDAAFQRLALDIEGVQGHRYALPRDLAPGTYYWRLAARHPMQGDGPFGSSQRFRRAPAAPIIASITRTPVSIDVAWTAVDGAGGYEVQLARDGAFQDVVSVEQVRELALRLVRPAPGRYFLRLRSVDDGGHVGPPEQIAQVDLPAAPAPPVLESPVPNARLTNARAQLSWRALPGVARYRVQLAKSARFDSVLFEQNDVLAPTMEPELKLGSGRYYWRVAAASDVDGEGAFSEPRLFQVLPPAPLLVSTKAKGSELILRWTSDQRAPQYHLQLAKDVQFEHVVIDRIAAGSELRTLRPAAGEYYARMSAIDAEGTESVFSEPRSFKVGPRYPYWLLPLIPLLFAM